MVDNKVALERRKAVAPAGAGAAAAAAAPPADAPVGVPTNVVNQLVAFIPTEVITIWVALLAVLNDPKPPPGKDICQADWSTHWILAIVVALLGSLLTLGLAYRKFADTPDVAFKWPIFQMIAAPVAFMAWAIALPESPLQSACWYTPAAGSFVVMFATVAVTTVGYILGENQRFQKA